MVAPVPHPETPEPSLALRRAHRLVAAALLKDEAASEEQPPPVAAAKAWLFAVWSVIATVLLLASLGGAFSR